MPYTALLDTCVLFPPTLADTLLQLAAADLYRPLWSEDVLTELKRNAGAHIGAAAIGRRVERMQAAFADAEVTGYAPLIDAMTNDTKDRHVLAAAVRGTADVLVTFNQADFPAPALEPWGVRVQHPDDFLLDQFSLAPQITLECLGQQAARNARPPSSVSDLLARLGGRLDCPRFAAEVRKFFD